MLTQKKLLISTGVCQESIEENIKRLDALASFIPGVIVVHDIRDFSVVYMSPSGLQRLGTTMEALKALGPNYHQRFFNSEESKEYVPKIMALLERNNNDEMLSLFQQVRANEKQPWQWYCSSIKIWMRDAAGKPQLTITVAIPIDPEHHITRKVSQLLKENDTLRKQYHEYYTLSEREKEILKLIALGKSSVEIAEGLHISISTATTHRRNIRRKLNATSSYELAQYARVFDLI